MMLLKHDFENRSNTSIEAQYNLNIAVLAFLAAIFMFDLARPIHNFFAVRHNRAIVNLRNWRFKNGWKIGRAHV